MTTTTTDASGIPFNNGKKRSPEDMHFQEKGLEMDENRNKLKPWGRSVSRGRRFVFSEPLFSSRSGELYDLTGPVCGLCGFGSKSFTEPCDGVLSDGLLHMEIVLRHVDICVADDALDGGKVNARSLHLRHISMTAAVGRQKRHLGDGLQRLFEQISK